MHWKPESPSLKEAPFSTEDKSIEYRNEVSKPLSKDGVQRAPLTNLDLVKLKVQNILANAAKKQNIICLPTGPCLQEVDKQVGKFLAILVAHLKHQFHPYRG